MRDIRIATCSRCVRSVGDNKAPETWPFSMEFVPERETKGCERGSLHPLQMGAGVRGLLQKDTVFCCFWLDDLAVGLLYGEQHQSRSCMYCLVMRE
jgi:hypothetical protein